MLDEEMKKLQDYYEPKLEGQREEIAKLTAIKQDLMHFRETEQETLDQLKSQQDLVN